MKKPDEKLLDTIFDECRQCGSCCKKYRKILLQPDEVTFIKKLEMHVTAAAQLVSSNSV